MVPYSAWPPSCRYFALQSINFWKLTPSLPRASFLRQRFHSHCGSLGPTSKPVCLADGDTLPRSSLPLFLSTFSARFGLASGSLR